MYIIYKTINKINQKYYIGVHNCTRNWYKGSGAILKRAIRKHGLDNFIRETLFVFDSEELAYAKEREIVNEEMLRDPLCYNLKLGGKGGKTGIVTVKCAKTGEMIGAVSILHPKYISGEWVHLLKGRDTFAKARVSALESRKGKPGPRAGTKQSDETRAKIRHSRIGTKQSDETKEKRSASLKGISWPSVTCPHCGKKGSGNSMKQWHFNRCKHKT